MWVFFVEGQSTASSDFCLLGMNEFGLLFYYNSFSLLLIVTF